MFTGFFYELRKEGVPVSLYEWITLMEALSKDLANSSLLDFYYLARSVLIKSETHYDKYDNAFSEYFKDITLPERTKKRLDSLIRSDDYDPQSAPELITDELTQTMLPEIMPDEELDELLRLNGTVEAKGALEDGKEQPKSKGGSPFGGENAGSGGGISFGSTGGMTAIKVAGRRKYKDYQDDNIRNIRQFEMALRTLRQLSTKQEGPKDELNIDATIEETGNNAGMLSLVWERPRRNNLKLIILMDTIGSIYSYHDVCKKLFNAANKATHFKEISFYYFHNCIYGRIYKTQWLDINLSMPTEEFFRLKNSEYRVLIVGDAKMGVQELTRVGGAVDWSAEYNTDTGITWLNRVARHFPYAVWLNPIPERMWGKGENYESITLVEEIFPMYELTPKGLEKAIKKLRAKAR